VIKVVIDTNVIVSAALTPYGKPARIIAHIANTESVMLFYSNEIMEEYKEVLARPQLRISTQTQARIISTIIEVGVLVVPLQSDVPLNDESDRKFYDTAKTSGAVLVTGNSKHYPIADFIITPADFVKAYINEVE
jgi:putative PIN family toxin of toxin-antitoxin system